MLGAIAGDIIGSLFEWNNVKTVDFELFNSQSRFTDDTVMTIAIADAILNRLSHNNYIVNEIEAEKIYAYKLKEYGRKYPNVGYGRMFEQWLSSEELKPYNSYGNGSAMRVSPIGFAFDTLEDVLEEAKRSAVVTHNHKEGIKGAQAVAGAVFLARTGNSKKDIKDFIEKKFGYNLNQHLDDIRPNYKFDSSCQGSVPQAIIAFLESENFEDAIRKAISIGGDSDTIACIAGGIAQAYYGEIPGFIVDRVRLILDSELKRILNTFNDRYEIGINKS
ncbi:ADP-ribosylglycohydrolase family protein [Acetivibrio clariflavus]|uniref:ADP-ribosylglycohydrolase n=1 Tax=Acetivibrio clariflavus (strain DSM 19732 / NBRC 101661 / EBR45) TaxID=720554 RepID=G8LV97_ACECE|nr:ADP-ribosylglycohydrolase family protein [Acetivibrio clariflavus]AEV67451.1 ADP-ribosylglycohydrolase [Acetivibrio clariflavus DSM 19732]HOQ01606.1 ADP-ribosylglycohydrolase family protein [Acetivibrio clariflavus]HPU42278.1 ADP-ribosylglycohydrolase family protein [Acetivibrio clariflavus]